MEIPPHRPAFWTRPVTATLPGLALLLTGVSAAALTAGLWLASTRPLLAAVLTVVVAVVAFVALLAFARPPAAADQTRTAAALETQVHENQRVVERFHTALQSADISSWEVDVPQGKFLWLENPIASIKQRDLDDLNALSLDAHIFVEDRPLFDVAYANAIANQTDRIAVRCRAYAADGVSMVYIQNYARLVKDASGNVVRLLGVTWDVTDEVQASETLRQQTEQLRAVERRFERAINGTQDGFWELDAVSGSNWCSPRVAQLLGFEAANLPGGNFLRTLTHPDDATKVDAAVLNHYESNAPFDLEIRLRTAADGYRWYRARASAERDVDGRAKCLSGSLQDVTEARAAREALVEATAVAQAASRAKSHFLANVSHEIRTPMNGIIGMTGLLSDTTLDRTQREYAETIRASADSLLTVINDILDLSKIEAGKLDLECIDVDLRVTVEDVGSMLAFQAATKGLELIVNIQPDVAERVLADPQRLRQCLINLASNAIKFTTRGEIVIEVRTEKDRHGVDMTRFEVRDTGMGIAKQTLPTLFHPFVQADSSTTRHFGGTGLGLSIVRRLVELMGGSVGVSSELGVGSTFHFMLPLPLAPPMLYPPPARRTPTGRILIVDDNATNQKVLSAQLTHAGYTVTTVGSGAAAVQQLQIAIASGRAIEMVITDYMMPNMDGAALGERIISMPALADTRLVMLTSVDRAGDTPRLAALGFAAYLTKPVRVRELLDAVAKVMAGEPRQWQMDTQPMITRNTLAQSGARRRFGGHVLLVEDNVVNQKVAVRFLERLGCTVEVASNGAEGVATYLARPCDIVLMDLQMPVMDGITATRHMREAETDRHTPIIALTANAMSGDRERCEAAGMDDYLTKPIELERLRGILTKYGMEQRQKGPTAGVAVPKISASPERPPLDLRAFNDITDGDAMFAQELIATFSSSGQQQIAELLAAVEAVDRTAVGKAAHKLKGGCANIYAHSLHDLAYSLETDAPTSSPETLLRVAQRLQQEFNRTCAFLNDPAVVPQPNQAVS